MTTCFWCFCLLRPVVPQQSRLSNSGSLVYTLINAMGILTLPPWPGACARRQVGGAVACRYIDQAWLVWSRCPGAKPWFLTFCLGSHLANALWKPSRCRCIAGQSFRTWFASSFSFPQYLHSGPCPFGSRCLSSRSALSCEAFARSLVMAWISLLRCPLNCR